jgi:creatinine amidohydrolase/Fe(II)-dependent formamide hydrolase-like protein
VDTVREQTLAALVTDLLQGYAKMGFKKAVLFSGHFETEHFSAISEGIKNTKSIQGAFLTAFDFCKEKVQELEDVNLTWPYAGDHAAEWETSLMLYAYPRLVQMNNAPETIELDMAGLPDYIRCRYPRRANQAYGRKIFNAILQGGIDMITKML